MSYSTFTLDITDSVAHIQLCRAEQLNTMNPAFWQELPKALKQLDEEARARAIVLSSTGKHFSAGMDLAVFTALGEGEKEPGRANESLRNKVLELQAVFSLLEDVRIPVLAAIQGGCIGGGVDMVTACDARYCTDDAFFCVQETNLGMTADLGTLQRLPYLIPHGVARELVYTGRRYYAQEALSHGLVNRVFNDRETMIKEVMSLAREIATKSPLAISGCKHSLNYSRDHNIQDSLLHLANWQSAMFKPTDITEALSAKAEGREALFEALQEKKPSSLF